jgi:hypothetical protein
MLVAFIVLGLAMVALGLWGRSEVARFLARHASIDNPEDFASFKALARRQMFGALALIVLAAAWTPLGIYLVVTKLPGALVAFALLGVVLGFVGKNAKALEVKSRGLPSEESLRSEYLRVGEHWVKKALPDF